MASMWRLTTRRLLIAMFWCGVAFAAITIETNEPYGILVASMAFTFAIMTLWVRLNLTSERSFVVVMTSLMIGFLILIGLAFAFLAR